MQDRHSNRMLSIPIKISLIVFCCLLLLGATCSYILLRYSKETTRIGENECYKLIGNIIKWAIEDELDHAETTIAAILQNDDVINYFANGDRANLYSVVFPFYEAVKDRVVKIHFHTTEGVSFLRVHNPDGYGDLLPEFRPMIREFVRAQEVMRGIEAGFDGFGLRVVKPIMVRGEAIGSVECGMEFGSFFLRRLSERYAGEYFFYGLDNGKPFLAAGTIAEPVCPLSEGLLNELAVSDNLQSSGCPYAKAHVLYPMTNVRGEIVGFIKAEISRLHLVEQLSAMRFSMLLLIPTLSLVIAVVSFFSLWKLMRPLESIVVETQRISTEIAAGNVHYQASMSETAPDFRPIIHSTNSIIRILREREMLLQAIVEGIPDVVYYLDALSWIVLWGNKNTVSRYPNVVGTNLKNPPNHLFFLREIALIDQTIVKRGIQSVQDCYNGEKNEECWEHLAVPVFDDLQRVVNVIRISRDITEKMSIQAALRKLNDELEKRVEAEVEKRKTQEEKAFLQARLASIGELATGIAHEINQPLNSIAFGIENMHNRFLEGDIDSAYLEDKTNAFFSDLERIRRIIDHVRLFARVRPDAYRVSFNPAHSLENVLNLVRVQMATHGIDLRLDVDENIHQLFGNPYQYEQVLLNLISNAKDAVEERIVLEAESNVDDPFAPVIALSMRMESNMVLFAIRDNGTGIPGEIQDRIFDPFFTTKKPGSGTGLGLSISFGIVRAMGGKIELSCIQGATVGKVLIPLEDKQSEWTD